MTLILASASKFRAELLRSAGVSFEIQPARIDEEAIKEAMLHEKAPPRDIADKLAELKAERIATKNPTSLILGADQILVQDKQLFSKASSMDEAKKHLQMLSGKTHVLLSAAVLFENGKPVWRHIGQAQCIMRSLSDSFIEWYLNTVDENILNSVGCYHIEGLGAQLFKRIQGDYFTVLGLPLLEILQILRQRDLIPE